VKAYSLLLDEVLDIGPETDDVDAILELADTMATSRPGIVVYLEERSLLQKWEQQQ
jgi:hypothetical protein